MDKQARGEMLIVAVIGGLEQAVAHWFPWNRALGHEMEPPFTYMVGMAPIIGLYSVWAARRRQLSGADAAIGICTITAASGLSVLAAYALDRLLGHSLAGRLRGMNG